MAMRYKSNFDADLHVNARGTAPSAAIKSRDLNFAVRWDEWDNFLGTPDVVNIEFLMSTVSSTAYRHDFLSIPLLEYIIVYYVAYINNNIKRFGVSIFAE